MRLSKIQISGSFLVQFFFEILALKLTKRYQIEIQKKSLDVKSGYKSCFMHEIHYVTVKLRFLENACYVCCSRFWSHYRQSALNHGLPWVYLFSKMAVLTLFSFKSIFCYFHFYLSTFYPLCGYSIFMDPVFFSE